jgi:fructose-1,6-bisphosphatase/inositol monophosphatase family enzyme|tara:strand:+ start:2828 stop:3499 length:672 start_codon:yes stop_codon:yes gene_type:complete
MIFNKITAEVLKQLTQVQQLRATRVQKSDGSYVTKGDLLVQEIVIDVITAELDDFQIISEELKNLDVDVHARDVFVVDPIDGTENFTSGFVEWGVSIAHYRDGSHFASLLLCPEMNLSIQTGDTFERHQSRVRGLSSSLSMEDLINATQGYEYRILGCCVYNMMCVLRGSFCSFENPKGANSWDILAGLNLALEHGLKVIVNDEEYHGEYLPHTQKYRFKVEG